MSIVVLDWHDVRGQPDPFDAVTSGVYDRGLFAVLTPTSAVEAG